MAKARAPVPEGRRNRNRSSAAARHPLQARSRNRCGAAGRRAEQYRRPEGSPTRRPTRSPPGTCSAAHSAT